MGKKDLTLKKNNKRCALSNKYIGGKEVIIIDYAIEYVKKQGYEVIQSKQKSGLETIITMCSLALFLGVIMLSMASAQTNLTDDIIRYFPLNETSGSIEDLVNGLNGTNSGGITGQEGKINYSYFLTGTNHLNLGNNADFNLLGQGFTFNFWFYPTDATTGTVLLAKNPNTGTRVIEVYLTATGFQLFLNGGSIYTTNTTLLSPLNEWKMITITYDKTEQEAKGYLNGILIGEGAFTSNLNNNSNNLHIGRNNFASSSNGRYDEIAIWNKALNISEIEYLLELQELGIFYPFSSLPEILTLPAVNIGKETATLKGEVISTIQNLTLFFSYRELNSSVWINTTNQTTNQTGIFSADINNLSEDTTYEFKFNALFDSSEIEGDILTFTTTQRDNFDIDLSTEEERFLIGLFTLIIFAVFSFGWIYKSKGAVLIAGLGIFLLGFSLLFSGYNILISVIIIFISLGVLGLSYRID